MAANVASAGLSVRDKRFPINLDKLAHAQQARRAPHGDAAPAQRIASTLAADAAAMLRHSVMLAAQPALGFAAVRSRMVARLRAEGAGDPRVFDAMTTIARDVFVASALAGQAYEDTALPIGHGQTISKPSIVARMLTLLHDGDNARRLGHLGRTLEIGTGCGYQAALLSLLSASVISVERLRALHDGARHALARVPDVKRTSLRLVLADGRHGHPPNAPYDSIVAAAVGDALPEAWIEQLAVGGRLVAPRAHGELQALVVVDRTTTGVVQRVHEAVRFVPLESGVVR